MTVRALVLFILASGYSAAYAKNASFEETRLRAISLIGSEEIQTLENLTGGTFENYQVPNRNHHAGVSHDMMIRYKKAGGYHLVKIVLVENLTRSYDQFFAGEVFGALLGESLGAPRIYGYGKVQVDGKVGYFLDMEELFPGVRNSFTLKGWRWAARWKSWLGVRPSENQMREMGDLLAQVFVSGITIQGDWDMIFANDQVRWIDTAQWSLAGPRTWPLIVEKGTHPGLVYDLNSIKSLITTIQYKDSKRGEILLRSFLARVFELTKGTHQGAGLRQMLAHAFKADASFCALKLTAHP